MTERKRRTILPVATAQAHARVSDSVEDRTPYSGEGDDADEIRFSLTALGEAVVAERSRARNRGFGPCSVATLEIAG